EFSTVSGRRYLIWKIDDQPSRVPDYAEVRDSVVEYWKMSKARILAENEAKAFVDAVNAKKGDLNAVTTELKKTVIVTAPTTRLATSFSGMPARENQFAELVEAGSELMDRAFQLQENQFIVSSNSTASIFYVLGLNSRRSVTPDQLYGPTGPFMRLVGSAMSDAMQSSRENWMKDLRKIAGLPEDWKLPSESK
ncbi:MAG: hypothetical protein RJA81_1928, partial [Planctomycetota bacterium]